MICLFGVWCMWGMLFYTHTHTHTHTQPAALRTTSNHFKTIFTDPSRSQPRKDWLEQLGHEDPKEVETERESAKRPFLHKNT